jgi:hypothetical protein
VPEWHGQLRGAAPVAEEKFMPQVALLTVHGMGATPPDYAATLFRGLRANPGVLPPDVDFRSVFYQDILKPNEEAVWTRAITHAPLHYAELRRFLLFGFGDAAGLENRKEIDGSAYEMAQAAIATQLLDAFAWAPDTALVFLAHSLGGQVLSSYLYDAQKAGAGAPVGAGIWKDIDAWSLRALRRRLDDAELRFLSGASCSALVTTGCNIPIFVASHRQMDIKPIAPLRPDFTWVNLYDLNDPLGWPLQPLSPGYAALVDDRVVNAGGGVLDWLLKSWNPWSHTAYWDAPAVLDVLAGLLRRAAGRDAFPDLPELRGP